LRDKTLGQAAGDGTGLAAADGLSIDPYDGQYFDRRSGQKHLRGTIKLLLRRVPFLYVHSFLSGERENHLSRHT
jgi:hypothetical protein